MKLTPDNLSLFSDTEGKRLPTNTLSHNYRIQRWGNFIAGYSIEFVEACLSELVPNENVVLDPFLGCGTTLVAARNLGFNGVGYEVHPIFYTLAQAKLTNYARDDITEIAHKLLTETMPIKWSSDAQKFITKMYSESNGEAISRAATAVNLAPVASKPLAVAVFLKACEMACEAQTDGIYKAPDSKKNSISFQSAVQLAASLFKEDIESNWYQTHWVNQPIPDYHLKSHQHTKTIMETIGFYSCPRNPIFWKIGFLKPCPNVPTKSDTQEIMYPRNPIFWKNRISQTVPKRAQKMTKKSSAQEIRYPRNPIF
jgi:hypothetical protein